jgi:hypothetical protein
MHRALVSFVLVSSSILAFAPGCAGSSGGTGGSGGSGTTSSTSSSKSSSASTTTSSTTGSTTSSSSTGGGVAGDHLLISEVVVTPDPGELVEIWNPTASPVALDDYYLSDNATYYQIAAGMPWMPKTSNAGTDFLARFPAGTTIPADGVLTIAFDVGYETTYSSCPDFFVTSAPVMCNGQTVPTMALTEAGSFSDISGLSNDREMLVLFTWDGNTTHTLKDVDYVTWGAMYDTGATRVDKSAVSGYQPDTAEGSQKPAPAPALFHSIERCAKDSGEKLSGGNGLTGHDETSEDMGASFVDQPTPTPGVKNACL